MRFLPLVTFLALSSVTAHAEIQFVGVMTLNGQQQFGLLDTDTKNSQWITIGGKFADLTLESYQSSESTVTVRQGETVKQLKLQPTPSAPAKPAEPAPEYYSVKAGDTGAKIARTFKMSVGDLAALNPEVQFAKLRVGDTIRIK